MPRNKGTGPKNFPKTMSPKAGRIAGGHSMKPKQPKSPGVRSKALRNKTNPSKAS